MDIDNLSLNDLKKLQKIEKKEKEKSNEAYLKNYFRNVISQLTNNSFTSYYLICLVDLLLLF